MYSTDWGLTGSTGGGVSEQKSSYAHLYSCSAPLPFRVDRNYSTLGLGRDPDTRA